jgi:hypothetical protein
MTKKQKGRTKSRKHTQVEYFELAGLKSHLSPVGLILYAENYLQAAKAALPIPGGGEFDPARLFLVGRSLELALKAFLSLRGFSLDQMADGAFGHNLERLLAESKTQNIDTLINLSADQEAEIIRVSIYYAEKVYEYPALGEAIRGYPSHANAARLIDAAGTLIAALWEPCMAA